MNLRRAVLGTLVGAALAASLAGGSRAEAPAGTWPTLGDGHVVLLRHAQAPGIGDPPGLRLGDCRTQRNLDDTGRAQARRIGEEFRRRQVVVGRVLASQWCRTLETAELAFPGRVQADADFNSFFGAPDERRSAQTAAARATLQRWRGPGVLVVVTHQVNISALAGDTVASGEGVVLKVEGGRLQPAGRLPP